MRPFLSCFRPVSVFFSARKPSSIAVTDDLIGTALVRAAKKGKSVCIDCRRMPVSADSYFACNQPLRPALLEEIYLRRERIFADRRTLRDFLRGVGRNPTHARYISFVPGARRRAAVIACIVRPPNAGRMLGLAAYEGIFSVDIIPAAPTCAAVFRPLIRSGAIHINFIDYFDRQIQAKGFFKDDELIISMTPKVCRRLAAAFNRSAHGAFNPSGLPVYPIPPLRTLDNQKSDYIDRNNQNP